MKKLSAVLLAIAMSLSVLAGCNKEDKIDVNDPQKLEIYIYDAGYGVDWCRDMLAAFKEEDWVKEKYPELKTSFTSDVIESNARDMISSPKKVNKYEVLFGTNLEEKLGPGLNVLELTDPVYNSKVPGEDVTVAEKMIPSYLANAAYSDGSITQDAAKQYYQMNWASGMVGIMYNADLLERLKFEVPNTSEELIAIMRDIKDDKDGEGAPIGDRYSSDRRAFATYGESYYAGMFCNVWWTQYQGEQGYCDFYNGYDPAVESKSPEVLHQTGILKAYEEFEKFLPTEKGYTWINPNTAKEAYRETQNAVLLGNRLFMCTGDWVVGELKTLYDSLENPDTVKMMRAPIISSIIDRTPSINDDATLSAVVTKIDAGAGYADRGEALAAVTQSDWEIIDEARHIVYGRGTGHNAYIPSFASGKEVAVDFLRYMATDKAQDIYLKATGGASLPFKYDVMSKNPTLYASLAPLQQERLSYANDAITLPSQYGFPLGRNGLKRDAASNPMSALVSGSKTARECYEEQYNYWNDNNRSKWNELLQLAHIQ